jgi:hypothetical protein
LEKINLNKTLGGKEDGNNNKIFIKLPEHPQTKIKYFNIQYSGVYSIAYGNNAKDNQILDLSSSYFELDDNGTSQTMFLSYNSYIKTI